MVTRPAGACSLGGCCGGYRVRCKHACSHLSLALAGERVWTLTSRDCVARSNAQIVEAGAHSMGPVSVGSCMPEFRISA